MLKKLASVIFVVITMGLAGCASIHQQEATNQVVAWPTRQKALSQFTVWQLKGKIAVRTPLEAQSLNLNWQQKGQDYQIALTAPFGIQGARIVGKANQVSLQLSDGRVLQAKTPEALLQQALGFKLPISYLSDWVKGTYVKNVPVEAHYDSLQRLSNFIQAGWLVQYPSYIQRGAIALPNHILINSPDLKVKIVIYTWS